ncbi:MAG: helix-hairpin-helix domain-containing protein [Rhodocyclaceae bacterium]|nr:helix-hairpin-helix domain-containing protein [Rhodocyclaceae bacterium]
MRFAGPMNYRIEGDVAHFEADLRVCDPARAAVADWKLQFWTDDGGPAVCIAEVPLGAVSAAQGAVVPVGGSALASLPAGDQAHRVGLRLACAGPDGEEQHDFSTFSHPQHFQLPRLGGTVGYRFEGEEVELSVAQIANPREASNLSGTLSLELWALPVAYLGGDFQGVPVAGIQLGSLAGQDAFVDLNFSLPASQLPPGEWHMTLMLREWTPSGFVTRDFSRFAQTYRVEAKAEAVTEVPAAKPALAEEPAPAAKPAPSAKPTSVAKPAPVAKPSEPAATAAAPSKEAAAKKAAVSKAAEPVNSKKAAAPIETVSINKARAAELAALKGVSKKLAESVVAGRPYAKVDELTRVKGLGPKLLDKLRSQLTL